MRRLGFAAQGVVLDRPCPACGGVRRVYSISIAERAWWCDVPDLDVGDERRHELPGDVGRQVQVDLTN